MPNPLNNPTSLEMRGTPSGSGSTALGEKPVSPGKVVIDYTNWKGARSKRTIIPISIRYGTSPFHNERDQWLLHAIDVDKLEEREFAMGNIHSWEDFPIPVRYS